MAKRGTAFDLAAASTVAAASTAMTLWHRLPMFGFVSTVSAAQRQDEASRMMDEKAAAFFEGSVDAGMEIYRAFSAAMTGQLGPLMNAPLAIANAGLKPAFRRVNANAKRLNRKAVRDALD